MPRRPVPAVALPKCTFAGRAALILTLALTLFNLTAVAALPAGLPVAWAPAPARAGAPAVRGEAGLTAGATSARIHQLSLSGRIELFGSLDPARHPGARESSGGSGQLDAGGGPGAAEWRITANPNLRLTVSDGSLPGQAGWQVSSQPFEWAVEEAYLAARQGAWVVSVGRERLPLEVARLSLPFSVEPVSAGGVRLGLWGVRLARSSGATRLRLAALEQEGRVMPAISLRWQAGALDLEGHALLTADRRPVTSGLTASGLVGDVVAYGELWRGPEWRYVGGLSGFWGDTLWTVEAGRAAPAPGQRVRRLVGAQFAWQQGAEVAWNVTQYAFIDEDGLRAQLAVDRTFATGPHESRLFASLTVGPGPLAWAIGAACRYYWGTGTL